MTTPTIQLESSNIQNILIALVVICAIVYAFLEFRKINMRIQELEEIMGKMNEGMSNIIMGNVRNNISNDQSKSPQSTQNNDEPKETEKQIQSVIEQKQVVNELEEIIDIEQSLPEKDIMMDSIINQVEEEIVNNVSPPIMGGLFISVETEVNPKAPVNSITESISTINNEDRIIDITEDEDDIENNIENKDKVESNESNESNESSNMDSPVEDTLLQDMSNNSMSYEEYTIKELKDKLISMNLPTSGNKSKLIERIISNENKM